MDKEQVKYALKEASEVVGDLPEHLQKKAFELAVQMLTGSVTTKPAPKEALHATHRQPRMHVDSGEPEVSDLLNQCKRNPDRYVIFFHDMEARGEKINNDSLLAIFGRYQQDSPKNVNRDLRNLVAKDWIERSGKDDDSSWILKRKGRTRYTEIIAKAKGGND